MEEDGKYLSEERLAGDLIRKQNTAFVEDGCSGYFDMYPHPLVVLNPQRQIVFGNKVFMDAVGKVKGEGEDILGRRFGEAMGCLYSAVEAGGCGASKFCTQCGVLKTLLDSMDRRIESDGECQMLLQGDDGVTARDYRVYSVPLDMETGTNYVVSIVDIGDRRRREVLERVFFHDILNSVSGAQGIVTLLLEETEGETREMVDLMRSSLFGLSEEILKHKDMVALENNEYVADLQSIRGKDLLQVIAKEYGAHPLALEKEIVFDESSPEVAVLADLTLLKRVIANMIVNALEATPEREKVKVGLESNGEGLARFWVHNGTTMEKSVRLQVFKRSFSTKGRSRGLGTYSIKLLAENYLDGRVGFSSTGEGTTFWVDVPME